MKDFTLTYNSRGQRMVTVQEIESARVIVSDGQKIARLGGRSAATPAELETVVKELEAAGCIVHPFPAPVLNLSALPESEQAALASALAQIESADNFQIVAHAPETYTQVLEWGQEVGADNAVATVVREVRYLPWRVPTEGELAKREVSESEDLSAEESHFAYLNLLRLSYIAGEIDAATYIQKLREDAGLSEVDAGLNFVKSGLDAGSEAAASGTDQEQGGEVGETASELPAPTLPDKFPGRAALIAAGYHSLGLVRGIDPAQLTQISGIGEATAGNILAALEEMPQGE